MSEYRTTKHFEEICESMWNGNWTQAANEVVEYGFWENDLLIAYDEAFPDECIGDNSIRVLRGLVTLAQMAASIRHEDVCDFRPCLRCKEYGMPLFKGESCSKCKEKAAIT